MTKFKFNSQVCTSRSQSERLLALGLKKETADMYHIRRIRNSNGADIPEIQQRWSLSFNRFITGVGYEEYDFLPAWSLGRLIEMMPEEMYGGLLCIFKDSIRYEEVIMDRLEAHFEVVGENMYENAISCIEWLIKEGYFPKEYLV